MSKACKICGKRAYSDYCFAHKARKPINQQGKKTKAYEKWKKEIAIPYLDKRYGRICSACKGEKCGNRLLDVDHIKKRSTNPALVMELSNIQYLGRFPCHYEKDL